MKDHPQSLIKSAGAFISGTMLSRISGLVRDISMAFCFGTQPAIAAFLVAFRFSNLLRRIFGEGALLTSFVPFFESYRTENPKRAAQFFRDLGFTLFFVLAAIILLGEIGLYGYWQTTTSESTQEILRLTMIMLPGVLFICLFTLCSGLLQCEKSFFLTGSAPIAFNIVWIAAIWLLRKETPQDAAIGLSIAITVAFLFQWAVTLPKTLRFLCAHLSCRELFRWRFFSIEIRQMMSSISLAIIGVGAAQFNSAIDTVFARYASLEGPAYLNYAIHLQQLPLALIGIAISSALLPPLSRAFKAENYGHYQTLLSFALTSLLSLLLPCVAAIICLGSSSVNLIYGRGDFSEYATLQTTWCLWGYGIGLIPMGIALLLGPAFYARKDYWTPTLAALTSVAANIMLNAVFVFGLQWGPASLGLATSLASCVNVLVLVYHLRQAIVLPAYFFVNGNVLKIGFCAALGVLCTAVVEHFLFGMTPWSVYWGHDVVFARGVVQQLWQFLLLFASFTGILLFLTWQLNLLKAFKLYNAPLRE